MISVFRKDGTNKMLNAAHIATVDQGQNPEDPIVCIATANGHQFVVTEAMDVVEAAIEANVGHLTFHGNFE